MMKQNTNTFSMCYSGFDWIVRRARGITTTAVIIVGFLLVGIAAHFTARPLQLLRWCGLSDKSWINWTLLNLNILTMQFFNVNCLFAIYFISPTKIRLAMPELKPGIKIFMPNHPSQADWILLPIALMARTFKIMHWIMKGSLKMNPFIEPIITAQHHAALTRNSSAREGDVQTITDSMQNVLVADEQPNFVVFNEGTTFEEDTFADQKSQTTFNIKTGETTANKYINPYQYLLNPRMTAAYALIKAAQASSKPYHIYSVTIIGRVCGKAPHFSLTDLMLGDLDEVDFEIIEWDNSQFPIVDKASTKPDPTFSAGINSMWQKHDENIAAFLEADPEPQPMLPSTPAALAATA